MANIFQSIRVTPPKRTAFDLGHDNILSTDFGRLTPILFTPTLPSDKGYIRSEFLIRLAPLMAPIMHRCNAYVHHFKVPERLLWKDFKDFITKGKDGKQRPIVPSVNINQGVIHGYPECFCPGSLWDYLGFPTLVSSANPPEEELNAIDENFSLRVPLMPFLAYYKIWQTYYADSNLATFIDEDFKLDSGIYGFEDKLTEYSNGADFEVWNLFSLKNRAWEKDYFTSALPFPQRGEDVTLPINGNAPVSGVAQIGFLRSDGSIPTSVSDLASPLYLNGSSGAAGGLPPRTRKTDGGPTESVLSKMRIQGIEADLTSASSATINELRRAFAVQKWLETNARAGYRYIEQIFSHFGVKSSDARLQRPEYLGGGKSPIQIGEVLQTSESSSESALADMAGRGISASGDNGVKFFCEEHCYIISILSVIPRSAYSQGLPRIFQKWEVEDYAWPEFAHLGEQEVKNNELYLQTGSNSSENNEKVFGYQSRYSEYKYIPSSYHGDMRTNLTFWHLGRMFLNPPGLNESFVTVDEAETNRIFAVTDNLKKGIDHLWIQVHNNVKMIRPLPKYGTPRL